MAPKDHRYEATVEWVGRADGEPWSYQHYSREHTTRVVGKADLPGSADPRFRGDPTRHNPEDLFVAAIAACHMLAYLALCARRGVEVVRYVDTALGTLEVGPDAAGRFTSVELRPSVGVHADSDLELAAALHHEAHERCFIANSCSVPIRCRPTVVIDQGRDA